MNVLPRAASSYQGATTASLDHCGNEEEDGYFHLFHAHKVQLGTPRKEAGTPLHQVVQSFPAKDGKINPLWQTVKWLKNCEGEYENDELIWWSLVCPLTDGSDTATLGLAQQLMIV